MLTWLNNITWDKILLCLIGFVAVRDFLAENFEFSWIKGKWRRLIFNKKKARPLQKGV